MIRFAHRFVALVALLALIAASASSAYADGKRKVTRFEYDGLGRQVKAQVYDDVGTAATLVSETETTYDAYSNVLTETQTRVPYDLVSNGTPVTINSYSSIIQLYAYEDTNWPTKVTKKYNPRWYNNDAYAERFYYDGTTGQLELSYNNDYYCTDPARGAGLRTPGTFSVEQSGASLDIEIRPYAYCNATHTTYDATNFHRPTLSKSSMALYYSKYNTATHDEYVWVENLFEYYPIGSPQKGALKRSITGDPSESLHFYMDYDWDAVGNLIKVTDNGQSGAQGYESTAQYDALRRVTRTTDPEGGENQYAYGQAGRLRDISAKIDTNNWAVTHAEYFPSGRLKSITDPDGDITVQNTYDLAGRIDVTTDGAGRKVKTLYYPNGQTKCTIKFGNDLQLAYAMFDYGPDGQVKAQRPAKGVTVTGGANPTGCITLNNTYDTTYRYDGYRRLYESVFPKRPEDLNITHATNGGRVDTDATHVRGAGHTYTRQWLNPNGNATQQRTRKGDIITATFRVDKAPFRKDTEDARYYQYSLGSGFKYSANVRPYLNGVYDNTYSIDNYQLVSHSFDQLGRKKYERSRFGYNGNLSPSLYTHTYYDDAGNLEKLKYDSGAYANYTYDKNGLMIGAGFSPTGSVNDEREIAGYKFDLLGRRTVSVLGNTVSAFDDTANLNYAFQDYKYDADSDLKELRGRWGKSDNTGHTGFFFRYDQDGSGKMIQQFINASNWRYTPPIDHTEDYLVDGPINSLDQYIGIGMDDSFVCPPKPTICSEAIVPREQIYDAAGNLTSDGAGRTYTYNSENQMTHATGPGLDMEYWYDAEGRRSYSLDHVSNTEVFHKHYGQMEVGDYMVCRTPLVNGECPTSNTIGVGKIEAYTPTFRIVLGAGVDEHIAYHDVDGDDLFLYMTNHQGSTVSMVKSSTDPTINGTRRAYVDGGRYVYDAYGNDAIGAPSTGNPYRYTGRRLDAQTGLYYYRARYYDPKQGRFLQTDPIGYEDQMNLYNYVGNDPLNATDPSGEAKIKWFVETVKGTWKRVSTRKQAVNSRSQGKNIDVQGPGNSKKAKQIEKEVQGDAKVVKHDQHPDSESIGPHYQPARRRPRSDKKKQGHTNYTNPSAIAVIAEGVSAEETFGSNPVTKALDLVNPFLDATYVAEGAVETAKGVDEIFGISEQTTEKATDFAIDLENWARAINGG